MTLKTLKPKVSNSLTLDDEFLQYCELNHIEDIQRLARETFKKGFDILKYGEVPDGLLSRAVSNEFITPGSVSVYVQPNPTKIVLNEKGETVIKQNEKVGKNDIYGE